MLAQERHAIILEMLRERNVVKITDIVARFGISHLTARRDLDALQDQGLVCRVYGGAVLTEQSASEESVGRKPRVNSSLVEVRCNAIAREALRLIREGDRIHLGNGIVVEEIARHLCNFRRLSIVTGSLAAANQLINSGHEVYVLGGQMNHEERNLSGSYALQMARDFRVNLTIVSCAGITPEGGIMSNYLPAAELGRVALENAERAVVLCNSSRIGMVGFHTVCPLTTVDAVITDNGITEAQKESLETCGVKVIVAVPEK